MRIIKLGLGLLFVAIFTSNLIAQDEADEDVASDKMFHTLGASYFLDWYSTPLEVTYKDRYYEKNTWGSYSETTVKADADSISLKADTTFNRYAGWSLTTLIYTFRYNIFEPSDDLAISLSTSPSIGLTFGDNGIGTVNLPFFINSEFGAGSTYNSSANVGGFIGLGYEYTISGILPFDLIDDGDIVEGVTVGSWGEFVFKAGVRFWSNSNKLKEISVKIGYSASEDLAPKTKFIFQRASTFQLAFSYILNY